MSSGLIPTEFGDTPTKVVFTGLAAGSGAALPLYNQIAGEVAAFLGKARQNRQISGQPSSTMQQARPNGGQFRYQYNNGQETVFVSLSQPETTLAKEIEKVPPILPNPPLLAIDVLISPRKQVVGNINSYRYETLPGHPDNNGGDPTDQPNFVVFYQNDNPPNHFPADDPFDFYDIQSGTVSINWGPGIGYLGTSWFNFGPDAVFPDPYGEMAGFHPSGTSATDISHANYIAVYAWQQGKSNFGFGPQPGLSMYWDCILYLSRTAPAGGNTQVRKDQNERRTYYNPLDVVGARVEPEGSNDAPYEADSLGKTTDKRLIPLMDGARVIVEKKLTFADGPLKPWMGAGFLAKPLKDFVAGQTPDKVLIDIYAAQTNINQHNTSGSAQPGSSFGADDGGMTWTMDPLGVIIEINVRELVDVGPYIVQVNLQSEGEIVKSGFASGNGTTIMQHARDASWRFAATGGWVDTLPDPADPAGVDFKGNPAMGKLLATSGSIGKVVAGLTPVPREMLDHVVWTNPVTAMTKIGTIEWKPTAELHQHGTAKITLL